MAATSQGETAAGRRGAGSGGGASPLSFCVALDTSVASRSMVGGARLARAESGGSVSSGLSSTIATVPYYLQPILPDSARPGAFSVLIESEPRLQLLF
jgi:hypothetical protein